MKKTALPEKLTEVQIQMISSVTNKWMKGALTAKPYNRSLIEKTVRQFFAPNPIVHYAANPFEAQQIAKGIHENNRAWSDKTFDRLEYKIFNLPALGVCLQKTLWDLTRDAAGIRRLIVRILDSLLSRGIAYSHSMPDHRITHLCAYYEVCLEMGYIKNKDHTFEHYGNLLLNSGVFTTILKGSHVIVSPHPEYIKLDSNGNLHSTNGPALKWNGYSLFFMNGINIPGSYFDLDADNKQDLLILFRERNVEVRKALVNRIGIETLIKGAGARTVHRYYDYELLSIQLPGFRRQLLYLKMANPSVENTWHIEAVPPDMTTCQQALAWRDGDQDGTYIAPEILT
jgi:hypothetical protein